MAKTSPFISIITVHFQDFSRLSITQQSIRPFLERGFAEWIVIDGNATPKLENERKILDAVRLEADTFISEPDDGIYDAMNKGMGLAKGEYTLFMNSGDKLTKEFKLKSLLKNFTHSKPDMIWGQTRCEYPDGSWGVKRVRGPSWMIYGMPVCHQSVLFLTRRFATMPYDTSFKIAADYELIARAIKNGAEVELVEEVISQYATGGISQANRIASLREESRVRVEYYGIPNIFSELVSRLKYILWIISDKNPAFNRFWRKRI